VNVAFLISFLERHARILLPAVILTSPVLTTVLFDDEVGSGDDDDFFRN
jgi:hypothetical protein